MPAEGRPDCTYAVLVSRADERPTADFWPFGLRDPLPTILIPLRPGDIDARLDLRAILDRVYDESAYEGFIYRHSPRATTYDAGARKLARHVPTG